MLLSKQKQKHIMHKNQAECLPRLGGHHKTRLQDTAKRPVDVGKDFRLLCSRKYLQSPEQCLASRI